MKTVKYISMVALIVMGAILASCESIEQNVVPVVEDNIVICKFTVSIGTDETKALDPTTRNKTFAAGEQIAVIYKNTNSETVTVLSEALPAGDYGDNATFTVTLTNPKPGSAVRYIYPAAMLATSVATDSDVNSDANVNYAALETQDGTLATLCSNLDLAIFDGTLTSEGALPAGEASLTNQLAILAITLKNSDGSSAISGVIKGMTLKAGSDTYTISRSAAEGIIYVAIRPTSGATIDVSANTGTMDYIKTLTGKTYAGNSGYNVSWRMTGPFKFAAAAVAGDLYKYVCTKGHIHDRADECTADCVAKIVYVGSATDHATYTHGLAFPLTVSTQKTGYDAPGACSNLNTTTPVANALWVLPSQNQWNTILSTALPHVPTDDPTNYNPDNNANYNAFKYLYLGQGCLNPFSSSTTYWSSTESTSGYAYCITMSSGGWNSSIKNGSKYVRAVLAF